MDLNGGGFGSAKVSACFGVGAISRETNTIIILTLQVVTRYFVKIHYFPSRKHQFQDVCQFPDGFIVAMDSSSAISQFLNDLPTEPTDPERLADLSVIAFNATDSFYLCYKNAAGHFRQRK
jgi:hypothetical protein